MNGPETNLDRKEHRATSKQSFATLLAVIQVPQLALGLAFTIARKFSFIIQKREQFWTSCATAAGANSFSVVGKSFTQSEMTTSSSAESGLRQWARQIWKRRFNEWPLNN